MEKEEQDLVRSIKRATVLSGIGMGLLLGLIMGLSVSEVVKVIMGTLTALLGAFLGFDKRNFTGMSADDYQKDQQNALFTALRAGWFGFAVVAGILFGMWIRTHEVFTLSVNKSVQEWTDAGYDVDYARKLVTYQRLAINPSTGVVGATTEVQRAHSSNLFSAEETQSLCASIDTDLWNNDWANAKGKMTDLKIAALTTFLTAVEANVPEKFRFRLFNGLRDIACNMNEKNNTELCNLGPDMGKWQSNDITSKTAAVISKIPQPNQKPMMEALSSLVCELGKK
jgi:hypothetical protein